MQTHNGIKPFRPACKFIAKRICKDGSGPLGLGGINSICHDQYFHMTMFSKEKILSKSNGKRRVRDFPKFKISSEKEHV